MPSMERLSAMRVSVVMVSNTKTLRVFFIVGMLLLGDLGKAMNYGDLKKAPNCTELYYLGLWEFINGGETGIRTLDRQSL